MTDATDASDIKRSARLRSALSRWKTTISSAEDRDSHGTKELVRHRVQVSDSGNRN